MVQRGCDALVAGATDPDAARAVIVKVWALGAAVAEDLLEDLVEVAVSTAGCTGAEPSTSQVLAALGHHEAAERIRTAVEAGRQAHQEAAARVLRLVSLAQERSSASSPPPAPPAPPTPPVASTSSPTSSPAERCAAPASPPAPRGVGLDVDVEDLMAEAPHHSVTSAASKQHEDPVADGAQKTSQYLMVAAQAAQTGLNLRAAFLNRRADRIGADSSAGSADGRAGSTGQLATPDPLQAARRIYAPMLARDQGRDASLQVALAAWQAAQPFAAEHRDARQAHQRAEARLRTLEPDAMERFAALRKGLGPEQAMREVIPLLTANAAAEQVRQSYAVVLGEQGAAGVGAADAARAWEAAAPLRAHVGAAEVAATRAEVRLRELHPQVMARFDELRVSNPQQAMVVTLEQLRDLSVRGQDARDVQAAAEQSVEQNREQPAPDQEAPAADDQERHAQVVRQVLEAELAAAVIADASWPKLAEAMQRCQAAGLAGAVVLEQAVQAREMSDAAHPAGVLAHRVRELTATSADRTSEQTTEQTSAPGPGPTGPSAQPLAQALAQAQASERYSEVAALRDLMFPIPLGSRSEQGHHQAPEQTPAVAALLREQGQREQVSAQVQAATPDDATTGVDEHREGVAASRDTLGRANTDLATAAALEAQGASSGWSAQDAEVRAGVQAAMMTFPTRLTSGALTEAHQTQQAQQSAAPAAGVKPPAPTAAPTTSTITRR